MKNQVYRITFTSPQPNLTAAQTIIGDSVNAEVIELIVSGCMSGLINDLEPPTLSEDGLVLTANRSWPMPLYEQLLAIQTPSDIKLAISNLDAVQDVEYDFFDM